MSNRRLIPTGLASVVFLVALAAAACTGAGTTPIPKTGSTTAPSTTPSPAIEGIAHPTGADEIILRFDESGGMMMAEWFAAHAPQFTLYGDGTTVFASTLETAPPSADGAMVNAPFRTAKLTEQQIQTLLEFALADGGLGIARAEYQNPLVADAPTAVFTINADGGSKTVSVMALGMEDQQPNADTAIKNALAGLGSRLREFDAGGSLGSEPFAPAGYRGVLTQAEGLQGVTFRDWPWADLTPADFALPANASAVPQGQRTLTPQQADAVGVKHFEGGIGGGVYLRDAAGKTYTFALRPLLPDETE